MRDQQPEPVSLGAAEKPSEEVLLNRYRVLARRGTGGFGTVCTCWDTRLQRRVAIKRIPVLDMDDGISASTAEEALGEARTACLLAHPNIVSVLDFEMEGAYAYLIMEYVDGLNLAELLSRVEGGTLSHDECAHMVASVGRALAFAHENGVLHLDIKPTNIMVDRRGTVKLADFGMATLASAAGYGDARGGTVGYMPPEQIQGMLVDERADVFSLAVVTWQALCGT
ncbi:MAG: serine/threonine protein kinase, partial [Olsenella sp.]|nr:serine/threonine protein kinase [Olsenella sp.]